MRNLRVFIFIFIFILIFLSSPLIHALLDNNCPNSYCGSNHYSINYPFKLQDQQPQICSNYINLTCSPHNVTLLNIPFSGDFHVVSIDYSAQSITLRDPQNCLAKRLMNLNLSSSPFSSEYYQKYTFYSCPLNKLMYGYDLIRIDCLSIFPNVTVATSDIPPEVMNTTLGCIEIVSKEIPVSYYGARYDTFSNLILRWNVPSCEDCEEFHPQRKDDNKSRTSKMLVVIILIPLVMVLAVLVATYKRVANARASRAAATEASQPQETASTTTAVQLVNVVGMMASDVDCSMSKTMIYSTFLEENLGSLEGKDQGSDCTICLEEFSPQDMIRCLTSCSHYFHSSCIDQWYQDNSSCPVCRNSIFDV